MSTPPIYTEGTNDGTHSANHADGAAYSERFQRLEGELAAQRDKLDGLFDLVRTEVQSIKKIQAEAPAMMGPTGGPALTTAEASAAVDENEARQWLLMQFFREIGTMFHMYLDPRYRIRRYTQLLVPFILALFAFNCFFFNVVFHLDFVSPAFEKIIDVVLAVLLAMVISREVARYRIVVKRITDWQDSHQSNHSVMISGEAPATEMDPERL